jgi:flagellar hook-associated protein FlgK
MKPIYSIRATEQSIAEINRDIRAQMDLPLDTKNFMIIESLLDERERLEAELAKLEAIE